MFENEGISPKEMEDLLGGDKVAELLEDCSSVLLLELSSEPKFREESDMLGKKLSARKKGKLLHY